MKIPLSALIPYFLLFVACLTDLKCRRIPNEITYSMFAAGVLYDAVSGGLSSVILGLKWTLLTLVAALLLARGFRLGGGDLKLLLACAFWLKGEIGIAVLVAFFAMFLFNVILEMVKHGFKAVASTVVLEVLYGQRKEAVGREQPGALFIALGYIAASIW